MGMWLLRPQRKDFSIRRKNETRYARCFQEGTTLSRSYLPNIPSFPFPFPRGGLKVPPTKPTILPLSLPRGGLKVPPIKPTSLSLFTFPPPQKKNQFTTLPLPLRGAKGP